MATERVDSIFDIPSLQEEFGQLVTILQQSKAGIVDLNNQRINLGNASISSFTQATNDLTAATTASTAATAKATTTAQGFTKSQLEAKLANQQRTAALKDEIASQSAAAGSYNALQLQLKQLTAQYKALSEVQRTGQKGLDMSKQITDINAQLKIFDASLGNYQRNVGNYNSSLGQLSKGIKGLGGLGLLLSNALGIDPSVAMGIEEVGRAIRDIQHTRELHDTGLQAEGALYQQNKEKIKSSAAALDGETVSIETNTVAKDTATTSSEALTAANAEAAVTEDTFAASTDTSTVALGAEAVAADAAAVSTRGLTAALVGTGIGAALIAVVAIIYELVEASKQQAAAFKSEVSAGTELLSFNGKLAAALKDFNSARRIYADEEETALQTHIENQKAAGVSSVEAIALDTKLTELKLKNAKTDIELSGVSKKSVDDLLEKSKVSSYALIADEKRKQDYMERTSAKGVKKNYDDVAKRYDHAIETSKAIADADKASFDLQNGIYQNYIKTTNDLDLQHTKASKLNADERRALTLAEATTEADIITSKNSIILSDDRATQEQRLTALKSNLSAQLSVIRANLNNVLTDPTKSATDKKIAQDKANADSIKNAGSYNQAVYNLNEKYRNEESKAQTDFENTQLTAQKEAGARLLTDRFQDLIANTSIIQKGGDADQKVLDHNFALAFLTQHLSTEQLLALREKYEADSVKVTEDTNDRIQKLNDKAVSDQVDTLKFLQEQKIKYRTDVSNDTTNQAATDVINKEQPRINNAGGEIRQRLEEKLQAQLTSIDDKGSLDRLKINSVEIKARLTASEAGGETNLKQTESINAELTQNARDQVTARKKIDDDSAKYKKQLRDGDLNLLDAAIQNSLEITNAFGDAQIAAEEDLLNRQATIQNRRDKMQENAINNSTVSEQQRAAAIEAIRKREELDQIAREKRLAMLEYKKAVFDKQIAEVQTLAQIAIDIAKQDYVAAALAGAALIKLAATYIPLPQYRTGRGEGKDEMAIVHPGEFINRGGQIEATPVVESLTHLMAKDKVYRNKNEMMRDIAFNSLSNYSVNKDGSIEESKLSEIRDAIYATGRATSQALKKQKGGNVFINLDGNWKNYISKRVKK